MKTNTAQFKKGQIVTVRAKGDRDFGPRPLLWRDSTPEDIRAWYESPSARGMDDAGETKLAPKSIYKQADGMTTYRVVMARTKAPRGYHEVSGCATVEDADGVLWYVDRKDMR